MSSHGTRDASPRATPGREPSLPPTIPFGLPAVTRLSWELGSRVTSDEDAMLLGTWEHRETGRTLEIHAVTSHTVVLGVRTPVGRKRYFGSTRADLDDRLARLEDADDWRQA